jgi:quinol monooxygenase YgiN
MIYEVATLRAKPGHDRHIEAAVRSARPLFKHALGFHSMLLHRSIEHPSHYRLVIGWNSIENHMVDFRNSTAFQQWRGLVEAHLAGLPEIEHFDIVDL